MLKLHDLCKNFPRMEGRDYEDLKASIAKNGQLMPIFLYDGKVLDGGNRYKAVLELEMDPIFEDYEGSDPVSFVIGMNKHRRHMNPGAMAVAVAACQDWAEAHGEGRAQLGTSAELTTVAQRAEKSGVSPRTQSKADRLVKKAPELAKKVAAGEETLYSATKKLDGKKSKADSGAPADYHPEQDRVSELTETIRTLDEENQLLKDAIAINAEPSEGQQTAAEIITELRAEIKTLTASLHAVSSTRDLLQTENAAMRRQMAMQRAEIKKLKGE